MRLRPSVALALLLVGAPAFGKDLPPLPHKIEVSIDAHSAGKLHGRALERFREHFRPEQLRETLSTLGDKPEVDGEVQSTLKELRKHGTILRSSFQSLDDRHLAPRALDRFVRVFGKLNDAIDNKVPEEIAKQSRRLGKLLEAQKLEALEGALHGFQPTSKLGFDRWVGESLTTLHRSVDRDELPAEEFHKVRKSLKNLLAVVHLLEGSKAETEATHETYKHLYAINELLGDEHDDLVRKDLKGKSDYDTTTVKVPSEVRQSIVDLRARFTNVASP